MMRRPTLQDGVLLPRLTGLVFAVLAAGVLFAAYGKAPWQADAAGWLIAAGVLGLVTVAAVGWRLVYGVVLGAGGWLVFTAVALHALPPQVAARQVWPLVTAAGVLVLASVALVAVLDGPGAKLAGGAWLVYAAVVARHLPPMVATWWPVLLAAGVLAIAGTLVMVQRARSGSQGRVKRWGARVRRNDGVASRWQLLRTGSRFAARRKLTVLRPSLAELSWWQQRRTPTTQVATRVARVGLLGVWSPCEDVTMSFGGPRKGKTGGLAGRIVDAPGAVIATSTRTDLIDLTRPLRERRGPIYVFNPAGLGGLASTITFDPIIGCEHPKTANDRAGDLVAAVSSPGREGGDRQFWTDQARRVLAALMHAAAIGGLGMRDVLVWIANPDEAKTEIARLLRRSPEPNYEADAVQFLETNDRTRTSITSTIMPALGWLTDATAARAATGGAFDVDRLLRERGTVYMLGAEDAQTTPLVTALTGHIAREARRIASEQPSGRLDPQLTLALDEAAIICPVPLDQWTADMGGRNITIHINVQSRAQLRQRFGDAGAAAILNNTSTLLIFGGTRDPEDLAAYVTLAGERDEEVRSYDHTQRQTTTTTRKVPVLTAAQIAQLPPGHVLIIRSSMPVALGRVQMAWTRRDVRRSLAAAKAAQQATEHAAPDVQVAGEVVVPGAGRGAERPVVGRWSRFLGWLDTDPVGSLLARLRVRRADRTARRAVAALPARADVQDSTGPGGPAGSGEQDGSRS